MKTYELSAPGALDGLTLTDRPEPVAGPGQVVVRVRATSLNYRDLLTALNPRQRIGTVPLSDGAGNIASVGPGVTRVKVGDRVAGTFFQNWDAGDIRAEAHDQALGGSIDGMLAEYVTLSERGVVPIPDFLSYEEAASLPCAAVTVWNALFETGTLTPGQTVLLLGTGGVSIFGLQLAHAMGARVILTSSSDEKLERARALGADDTINYKTTPDWDKAVWERTGKHGVDHVVEVGGAGTLEKSLKAVRYGGTVSLIGVLTGVIGQINPALILQRSVRTQGVYVGSRTMFENLLRALTQNQLHPILDRVFPFTDARAAYEHLQSGSHFGKIIVQVSE